MMKHGCEEPPRGCQKRLIDRSSWHQGYIEVLEKGTVKSQDTNCEKTNSKESGLLRYRQETQGQRQNTGQGA